MRILIKLALLLSMPLPAFESSKRNNEPRPEALIDCNRGDATISSTTYAPTSKTANELLKIKLFQQGNEGNCYTIALINDNIIENGERGGDSQYYQKLKECVESKNPEHDITDGVTPGSDEQHAILKCKEEYEESIGNDINLYNVQYNFYLKYHCGKNNPANSSTALVGLMCSSPDSHHAYSVISSEPNAQGGADFTLSNPHNPKQPIQFSTDSDGKGVIVERGKKRDCEVSHVLVET